MSEDNKILHLAVNYNKFDEIVAGNDNCVYLDCLERWNSLLNIKKYRKIKLCRGLYKKPQTMLYKIKNINLYYGENDLEKPKVWIVRLSERIN